MLFAALAPSISQAMTGARGDVFTEICSAAGIKMVKTVYDQGDQAPSAHLEHCQFCATHPSASDLLPGHAWSIPLLGGGDTHPPLFFQAPSPLAIWIVAQSRAPPATV